MAADAIQIVGVALVITVLLTFLRKEYAPLGAQVSIALVLAIFIWLLRPLGGLVDALSTMAAQAGVRSVYLNIVLKAIGIAAVTSVGAELCNDAGEEAVGHIVELVGKVFILALALPVVRAILDVITQLLPG